MEKYEEIIQFWFEGVDDDTVINKGANPFQKWFKQDKDFDNEIKKRFEPDYQKAKKGECSGWRDSLQGALALILLFDQFSRNLYRHTRAMYETDHLALEVCLPMIEANKDEQLNLIERVFVYMPLAHCEDLHMQNLSLKCFQTLVEDVEDFNPDNCGYYQWHLDYAQKHHSAIKQFQRFPHRNSILKRSSSAQEKNYLNSMI